MAADVGQAEEWTGLKRRRSRRGVQLYIEDLREEFAAGFVFPTMMAGAVYEGTVSSGHIVRAAAHRAASGGDRPQGRRGCGTHGATARATIR